MHRQKTQPRELTMEDFLCRKRFCDSRFSRRHLKKAAQACKASGRIQRRLRPDLSYLVKHSSIAAVQLYWGPDSVADMHGTVVPVTVVCSNGRLDCTLAGYNVGLPPEAVQRYLLRQFRRVFALPVSQREAFVQAHQQLRRIFP